MKSSHDPNLTSWALNELSQTERASFEEALKKNPDLLTEAETTQNFCRFIQNHLRDEKAVLTDAQRTRLKATALINAQQARDARASAADVIKPKPRQWWQNPSVVLPLSAAAAIVLGLAPFLSRKLAPEQMNESVGHELVATATPEPQPTRSVLSPAPSIQSDDTVVAQHMAAFQPVKLVADVESRLKTARRELLELDLAQLRSEASGAVRIVKSGAGALEAGEKPVATLGHLVSYTKPASVLSFANAVEGTGGLMKTGGATLALVGNNSYTGGTVISGGVMNAGITTASFGGVVGNGAVRMRAGTFTTVTTIASEGRSDLGYLSDAKNESVVSFGAGRAAVTRTSGTQTAAHLPASPAAPLVPASPAPVPMLADTGDLAIGSGGVIVTAGQVAAPSPKPKLPAPSTSEAKKWAAQTVPALINGTYVESQRMDITKSKSGLPSLLPSSDERELARITKHESASGESYTPITENALTEVAAQPLSTFSIDVDTAAYANVRRFLNSGQRPPADAVRIEEMINYFPYDYEFPQRGEAPFTVGTAVAEAPWSPTHRLARIAIKASDVGMERRQSNFVFLVDVSGSMDEPNKLPLVQQSLGLLTDQLTADDRVAIVTYAGSSGLILASTAGDKKDEIRRAIREMKAGGSTHGSAGIRQAYEEAQRSFIKEGVNRVILCTDGDFNVGIASTQELETFIKEKATSGVFLSVLGYGTGNTKDAIMETLADKGNGNYAYIDSLSEARKVLVEQMRGTLVTIAKDVKIQVEFNPTLVRAYRLIGYENRMLAKEDFNNDRKDAGEIGAGHTVTALYEIVPVSATTPDGRPVVDALKYQAIPAAVPSDAAKSGEMMTVKLRYKKPDGDKSDLIDFPVKDEGKLLKDSEREFKFATAVAGFGLLLRNSTYKGEMTWENVRQLAISAKGEDPSGYRGEFIQLIDKARGILGDGQP